MTCLEVKFIMVGAPARGSGDRSWDDALMDRIRSAPNLAYVGRKSQKEVNEFLARAHVFVNTSLIRGIRQHFCSSVDA